MSSKRNEHLDREQLAYLKDRLLTEAHKVKQNLEFNRTESETQATEGRDEVDTANDELLLATNLRFASRENFYLKKLNRAIGKVETEEFGICEECGDPISFKRLKARPTSELCISCKEDAEQMERQNILFHNSKSYGDSMDGMQKIG